jgi:NADH-quinone oxidoreductase subunit G
VVASDRPTALDGGAEETARYAPGAAAAFLAALARELAPDAKPESDDLYRADAEQIAGELRPGRTVVIWGERIGHGDHGPAALEALLACARELRCEEPGAGLLEVPEAPNGRGLREVGCLPGIGPGLAEAPAGSSVDEIREALSAGELDAVVLFEIDPVRDLPNGPAWHEALRTARTVIAVSAFENGSTEYADVVLPAEFYAEKEGTVTHPDGRVQRLRATVPHPGEVRFGWQWLVELSALLGDETGIDSALEGLEAIASEIPFYAGLSHDEIGGQGVRWQERGPASSFSTATVGGAGPPEADSAKTTSAGTDGLPLAEASVGPTPPPAADANGGLRLGTYRDLWATEVTDRNPALRFLAPRQTVELALSDGERLGLSDGEQVEVRSNGTSVRARVALRERMRPGAAFLIEGTATDNANALAGAETVEISKLEGATE